MSDYNIAILPGDGTGREVAVEAQKILETIVENTNIGFEFTEIACGGQNYKETGEELWKYKLPAGGYATPITYKKDGKQYVVIACGGCLLYTSPSPRDS